MGKGNPEKDIQEAIEKLKGISNYLMDLYELLTNPTAVKAITRMGIMGLIGNTIPAQVKWKVDDVIDVLEGLGLEEGA